MKWNIFHSTIILSVVEVYKLANELGVSSVEIIASMEKLGVPVELPNPTVSIDDAQRIRASFKKSSGFSFKNTSLFLSAVVSLSLVLSINSDRVFADDTASPQVITSQTLQFLNQLCLLYCPLKNKLLLHLRQLKILSPLWCKKSLWI